MTAAATQFRLVGAAGARMPSGMPLYVSWPLAEIEADSDGLTLRLHWPWVLRVLRVVWFPIKNMLRWGHGDWWSASWEDVTRVEASKRAVVVYRVDGSTAKFVALRRGRAEELVSAIHARGVPLTRIRSAAFRLAK